MSTFLILVVALLLDAVFGEPDLLWRRVPHPAVLMGRLVRWCDATLNKGDLRRPKGVLAVILLLSLAASAGWLLSLLGPIVETILAAILLAQRSLVRHLSDVADGLRLSLAQGRRSVAKIVSRNTDGLQPPAVARAAIESGAENLSDGVVAPALWFLIGGLPGLLIYKMVNTADSMIGYRTPQYEAFGWAAARLDDVLNWVPARLTALLIALPGGVIGQWQHIKEDAALHRSPNAGWPEAAMAQALNIALAGPRAYDGKMQDFAWVNIGGRRDIGPVEIDATVTQLWQAWITLLVCVICVGLITI